MVAMDTREAIHHRNDVDQGPGTGTSTAENEDLPRNTNVTPGTTSTPTSTVASGQAESRAADPVPALSSAPVTQTPLAQSDATPSDLSHHQQPQQQQQEEHQRASSSSPPSFPPPADETTAEPGPSSGPGAGLTSPSPSSGSQQHSGHAFASASAGHGHLDSSDSASVNAPSSFSVGLSIDTDDSSDADSALGSVRAQSSSISASSSIFDFVEEHGRTWHRYHEGKYFMPNDIPEQERLDLQHSISVRLLGGLYLAPIGRPGRALDVGTGTGIWAIEFANEHPETDVLGTDLSPIQPEYVPPNCRFEVDDAEDEWVFSHKFDFIHSRFMSGSISNFPDLFGMCFENLNPGGWVEMVDYYVKLQAVDDSLVGTALEKWNDCVIEGVKRMGKNALACAKYKRQMEEAGFVDVVEKRVALPGNPWAKGEAQKMLGTMQMENILDGLHGFSIGLFTKMLGMAAEEVELMLVDVRRDLRNTKIHFYYVVYCVYGRRP